MRLVAAALLTLVLAVPASAGQRTIGSNLKASPGAPRSTPVDAVYWNTALAAGAGVKVPAKGELSVVKLKGRVKRSGGVAPPVALFAQVLRPRADGSVEVVTTSGPLKLPVGGKRGRITKYRLQREPARVCVQKGDYVALASNGGFEPANYPNGVPLQFFTKVPGSAFDFFSEAGGDMNGDVFTGAPQADRELLMRTRIATGSDARPFCQ